MQNQKRMKFRLQFFTGDPAPTPQPVKISDLANVTAEATAAAVKAVMAEVNVGMGDMMKSLFDNFQVESQKNHVKSYEDLVAGAKTVDTAGQTRNEPGIKLARLMKAKFVAAQDGISTIDAAKQMYGHDKAFIDDFEKQVSVTGDGGFLVPEAYAAEIIPLLYAETAVIRLGARRLPMPNGNLNFPKLISGTDAEYIGENRAKNAKNPKYANIKLSAKKLRAKVVVSNDILRSSAYEADMSIRDDMVMQMALKMDFTAMFGAGTQFSPRGISNIPNVNKPAATQGLPTAANIGDPVKAVERNNSAMKSPGWIFNTDFKWLVWAITDGNGNFIYRDQLDRGLLLGHPFVVSNQIPTGTTGKNTTTVFFGDFAEFLIGDQMAMEIKAFDQMTYKDEAGNDQNAADNDQTVFQGIMIHDMAASHGEVFSVFTFDTIA